MGQKNGESLRQWISRIERRLNQNICCSSSSGSEGGSGEGSPFAIVGSGLPSYSETDDAYRLGLSGFGETNPEELIDLVGNNTTGGAKFNYTFSNGQQTKISIADTHLSEQGFPDARIVALGSFDNGVQFSGENYFSYVWAGDTSGIGAYPISLASGVSNTDGSNYARQWAYALAGATRPEDEYYHLIQARNEDNDLAFIKIGTAGDDPGFDQQAAIQISAYDVNLNGIGEVLVHNHGVQMRGLITFDEHTNTPGSDFYGSGVFIEGYTHTDDIGRTGTAATTIGSMVSLAAFDANGVMMETQGYQESGTRAGDNLSIQIGDTDQYPYLNYSRADRTLTWVGGGGGVVSGIKFTASSSIQSTLALGGATIPTPTGAQNITFGVASGVLETMTNSASWNIMVGRNLTTTVNGDYSANFGSGHTINNVNTLAVGSGNTVNGQSAIALGAGLDAPSAREVVVGSFNDTYVAANANTFDSSDRAFTVGIGSNTGSEANGFIVDKSGNASFPSLTDALIEAAGNDSAVTKGWVNSFIQTVKVTVNAAALKTLASSPVTLISAPGAGYRLDILAASAKLNWGSVAFDANNIFIHFGGSSIGTIGTGFISATANDEAKFLPNTTLSQYNQVAENAALILEGSDSVATGDSTMDIYITYTTIEL